MPAGLRLPRGATLTPASFAARHRVVQGVVWLNLVGLLVLGVLSDEPFLHVLAAAALIAVLAVLGRALPRPGTRAALTSVALMGCSYLAIHVAGGRVDAHFHLFVALVFVALYQQWSALLWAVVAVVVHHGVLGLLAPHAVFGEMASHHGADLPGAALVGLVALHAAFVVVEVVGILVLWHFAEQTEREVNDAVLAAGAAREEAVLATAQAQQEAAVVEEERARRLDTLLASLTAQADEIAQVARTAAEQVVTAEQRADSLTAAAQDVARRAQDAAEAADRGRQVSGRSREQMSALDASAGRIAEVIGSVSAVAAQTNMLALNATIEAARAGEAGRGFAVVSGEVKELAASTAHSAGTIESAVRAVQQGSAQVAEAFDETTSAVDRIAAIQDEIEAAARSQVAVVAQVREDLAAAAAGATEIVHHVDRLVAGMRV
ncbi:methyl-accepting chemotaxis protein [Cellulomonas sp. SLBN-39]|uniref:methyl-accepting chemotaxis protein n=1 Tax=Cellulomonas sp. SLBN-39 TaxID=2768446 RepID=UPI001153112B|nr:methyl-accepting chemotaxis protein [Cellulomonas sp. SLBN-39]TQL03475.1 methyl-accepting chemotaxis protein [Cellulomonas sp. SLBN-39]